MINQPLIYTGFMIKMAVKRKKNKVKRGGIKALVICYLITIFLTNFFFVQFLRHFMFLIF